MINGRRILTIFHANNGSRPLERTCREIPAGGIDAMVLIDATGRDETVTRARELGVRCVLRAPGDRGAGECLLLALQKALELEAEVVLTIPARGGTSPRLSEALGSLVAHDLYDIAIGSRMIGRRAFDGCMSLATYAGNRVLNLLQNFCVHSQLSDWHSGYRAYSREVIERLPLLENRRTRLFENQALAQAITLGYRVGEVSCPLPPAAESGASTLVDAASYAADVAKVSAESLLHRWGLRRADFLVPSGRTLSDLPASPSGSVVGKTVRAKRGSVRMR